MTTHNKCKGEYPCRVPPHPELQARLSEQGALLRQNSSGSPPDNTFRDESVILSGPTGHVAGLNDGTIFPESHFAAPVPARVMASAALDRAPLRGSIRVAVVLVDFSDKPMQTGAAQRFQDLFFSTGSIPTGSVTEYYSDVSGGQISLTGKVVGPYRMPRTLAGYANGDNGFGSVAPNLQTLAADALTAARSNINFGPYDNDGNGYVDAFVVVHAGQGGEVTGNKNDIWSAKWVLPNEVAVDGVKVYAFLTIPEDAFIGVCAHELGHLVFGWPDLYDTDYSSQGVGNWCLMAGGSWGGTPHGTQPCHPSAWCKANQGWVNVVVESQNHRITLGDVKPTKDVRRLWKNGNAASKEYFLIENRGQAGFDSSLPAGGLLVWHIDDSISSNADENHPKVGLMQADGLNQLAQSAAGRGDAGDPFPGRSNNTLFTATSSPSSKSYSGEDTFVSIKDISPNGQHMTMEITVAAH